jgi:hypothetical protein
MAASNPEHVAFTARVRELLDRAGFIERPEPEALGEEDARGRPRRAFQNEGSGWLRW